MTQAKAHIASAKKSLGIQKRVLFVEGKDDVAVYSKWLSQIDPLFASRLEVIATNGKSDLDSALAALGNPKDAFALRDRDDWDAIRAASAQAASPGLLVNFGRHCLEIFLRSVRIGDDSKYGRSDELSAPDCRVAGVDCRALGVLGRSLVDVNNRHVATDRYGFGGLRVVLPRSNSSPGGCRHSGTRSNLGQVGR